MDILLALAVGIIIGWNVPQPPWAKDMQDRVVRWTKATLDKLNR